MPAVSPDLDDRERSCVEQVLRSAPVAYVAMVEPPAPCAATTGAAALDAAALDAATLDAPRPYVVPMNFAYQPPATTPAPSAGGAPEGRLLLHTGPGRKVDALAQNPRVCVTVISQEELRLGPTPCQDGYLYQSVVVEGRATLLTDEVEREQALRTIVAKYDPEASTKPFDPRIFAQTLLYAVDIDVIGFKERPKRG